MTAETAKILDEIRPELRRVLPEGARALLFGSRARGDERPDSDFDILVLLDHEGRATVEDNMGTGYDVNALFWSRDRNVGTIVVTNDEWQKKNITPFYGEVMNDAIRIA